MRSLPCMVMAVVLAAAAASAQEYDSNMLGTYSSIAIDPATGEIDMGVQSTAFGSGNRAVSIKGGLAVVAHQASANPMYASIGFELLETGLTPQDALDFMLLALCRPSEAGGVGSGWRSDPSHPAPPGIAGRRARMGPSRARPRGEATD